ncbi:uncharacterized protein LOC109703905 [Ananas comosus]|uniref:Uncharacterized protein LOC109703905 n=1 Tax=Ananas comosus TaxID=4615 RepID=A0A6P5EEZ0_ANACO|nr:uncharacterized protein LOC109703905 [Ananas comosus]
MTLRVLLILAITILLLGTGNCKLMHPAVARPIPSLISSDDTLSAIPTKIGENSGAPNVEEEKVALFPTRPFFLPPRLPPCMSKSANEISSTHLQHGFMRACNAGNI